jgi:hypothetical protein
MKWKLKYGLNFKIIASQELGLLQYKFSDSKGKEINLKKELEKLEETKK